MRVWALSDLHLSLADKKKHMGAFGSAWEKYEERIAKHWHRLVAVEDLVLIAGDISWAQRLPNALPDLQWIDALPGHKVLLKGNHDYWWSSARQLRLQMPPSLSIIQGDVFQSTKVAIGGTRLWERTGNAEDEKIYQREIAQLERSLRQLPPGKRKLAMTHYPPLEMEMTQSPATRLLEQYGVEICTFGHLHALSGGTFGVMKGVSYVLSSCDYLACKPCLLCQL